MLVTNEAFAFGLIRKNFRASQYARPIIFSAISETGSFLKYSRSKNSPNRIWRSIYRQLLGFGLCATERFAVRHDASDAHAIMDSVSDLIREATLRHMPSFKPDANPAVTLRFFALDDRIIQFARLKFPYVTPERVISAPVVDFFATSIARILSDDFTTSRASIRLTPGIEGRLARFAHCLLQNPAFVDLTNC